MTESTVETSSKSEQDSEFRASDQASGQEKEHDSDDEMFATLKNQLAVSSFKKVFQTNLKLV